MLTPQDYGLLALTTILTAFMSLFATGGLGAAIVQKADLSESQVDFVFWTNLLVGSTLSGLLALLAPFVAVFYNEPRLSDVVPIMALAFIPTGLETVPAALLQKNFRFRELAIADTGAALVSGLLALYLAYSGFGVYALVLQALALQTVSAFLKWRASRWTPSFRYSWATGKVLLSYGFNLLGFNLVNYWGRNGDNFLIGFFRGSVELGLYSRAYNLMMLPVVQVHSVLSGVMHPALSAKQKDHASLRSSFLMANQTIALIMFPTMMGLIAIAPDLIPLLFGPQWSGVVPIIQVLAFAGMGGAVGTTTGWIYMAVGRTDLQFRWSLAAVPVLLLSYWVGVHYSGALGVAVAYNVALYGILWCPQWHLAGRLIGLSLSESMRNLWKPFVCSMVMLGALVLLRAKLPAAYNPWVRLAVLVGAGTGLYAVGVEALHIPAYRSLRGKIWTRLVG
jgi:PST family polysaccharide transporter